MLEEIAAGDSLPQDVARLLTLGLQEKQKPHAAAPAECAACWLHAYQWTTITHANPCISFSFSFFNAFNTSSSSVIVHHHPTHFSPPHFFFPPAKAGKEWQTATGRQQSHNLLTHKSSAQRALIRNSLKIQTRWQVCK